MAQCKVQGLSLQSILKNDCRLCDLKIKLEKKLKNQKSHKIHENYYFNASISIMKQMITEAAFITISVWYDNVDLFVAHLQHLLVLSVIHFLKNPFHSIYKSFSIPYIHYS